MGTKDYGYRYGSSSVQVFPFSGPFGYNLGTISGPFFRVQTKDNSLRSNWSEVLPVWGPRAIAFVQFLSGFSLVGTRAYGLIVCLLFDCSRVWDQRLYFSFCLRTKEYSFLHF